MKNTLESAIAFIKSRPHYKAAIADPIIVDQAAKDLFAYAASVRPEVVVPSERWISGFDRYYSRPSVMDTIEEINRLNPTMTFTELNHEK
jgi:hypothetical protein